MNLKHSFALLGLAAGFLLSFGIPAQANTTFQDVAAEADVCLKDYYSFVLNVKPREMQGAIYTDMVRNLCQVNDLLPLYEEYDELKNQYLNLAMNCGSNERYEAEVAEVQLEMKRVLLEQYFIRNVQVTARNQKEIEDIETRTESILAILKADMSERFVTGEAMVTDKELTLMFDNWTSKYEDTILNYSSCEEGPVYEIFESWFSFQETLNSLDFEIEKPERKGFWNVVKPEVDTSGAVEGFNDGVQNVTNAWDKMMNNFRFEEEERAIEEETSAGTTESISPNTFDAYFDSLKSAGNEDDILESSALRMAEYELLYGEIGAVTTTRSVLILDQLNQTIINNNVQDFPAIREVLDEIYGKQCSG